MLWFYLITATVIGHLSCAIYLYQKSKDVTWALKGILLGLIAVYLYRKKPLSS